MKRWIKNLIVTLSALVLVMFLGCSLMQDAATPCYIEPGAALYADANSTSFLPFTSLFDAYRIDDKMDYVHQVKQVDYARLAEDDTMLYGYFKGTHTVNIQAGQEFQRTMFSPEGIVGAVIPMLSGGVLGALLIPRPGDTKKKKE